MATLQTPITSTTDPSQINGEKKSQVLLIGPAPFRIDKAGNMSEIAPNSTGDAPATITVIATWLSSS